jgi:hypothetical protein
VTGVVALLGILAGAERKRSRYSLGVIPIDRRTDRLVLVVPKDHPVGKRRRIS